MPLHPPEEHSVEQRHSARREPKLLQKLPKAGGRPNYLKLAVDYLRTPRFNPLDMTNDSRSVLAFNLSYLFDRTDILELAMRDIMGWVAEGKLRPAPATEYPLEKVADAHRDIESGKTVGKLVLVP